jgi:hypothetical protein
MRVGIVMRRRRCVTQTPCCVAQIFCLLVTLGISLTSGGAVGYIMSLLPTLPRWVRRWSLLCAALRCAVL